MKLVQCQPRLNREIPPIVVEGVRFNTNQNKKYHNFERNEIHATVFLKWTEFGSKNNLCKKSTGISAFLIWFSIPEIRIFFVLLCYILCLCLSGCCLPLYGTCGMWKRAHKDCVVNSWDYCVPANQKKKLVLWIWCPPSHWQTGGQEFPTLLCWNLEVKGLVPTTQHLT